MRQYTLGFILVLLCACTGQEGMDQAHNYAHWRHYLGDPARSHFSTLDQIDTTNVQQIQLAWTYRSGGLTPGRTTQIQTNPLIIDSVLYGVNPAIELFALDAETGQKKWTYVPEAKDKTGLGMNRGLSYWESQQPDQDSRLFFASGYRLYAVSALTGKAVTSFGEKGSIDLRAGLGRPIDKIAVFANTPGAIYKDLLIMGTRVGEGPGAAPGFIRAYDVHTGAIIWTFHTIPQPGEFGYETWPTDAYQTVGGANSWAGITMDQDRGIAYVPTGSAAFDWYGGDRHGENLFANCLLALDAATGERIWHFQFVRHDLWDRDLPAPPNLFDMERNGKKIPAVAQVTKSGHVFVFNRLTGDPLFPIEEKAYPSSPLEGEKAYATQPLPIKPAPFSRQQLTENDLYAPHRPAFVDDFIDKDQNLDPPTVLEKLQRVTSKGQFVPIDTVGTILYPGADGGAEWGGAALDPRTATMYVNANEMAWIMRMKRINTDGPDNSLGGETLTQIHCARCHGGALQGLAGAPELQNVKEKFSLNAIARIVKKGIGTMPGMPNLSDAEVDAIAHFISGKEAPESISSTTTTQVPYAVAGFGRFKDDRGFPVMKPPWGTLNAINLNSGEYLWTVPLGHEEKLNDPAIPVSGTENYGGPVITAGGVLFIAATNDAKIRAFKLSTGELLWEDQLPAGGYATPATYQINNRQFLVVACGGGKMGTPSGDEYRAYALPPDF